MRRPLPCVHFKSQEPLQTFARVSLARTVTPGPPGGHWQVDQQHCDGLPPLGSILQGCGTGLTQVFWRRNPRTTLPTGTWKGWYGAHSRVSAVGIHPRSHVPSMFKHVKSKSPWPRSSLWNFKSWHHCARHISEKTMPGTNLPPFGSTLNQKSVLCSDNLCIENLCAIFLVLEIQRWRSSQVCGIYMIVEERLGWENINEYYNSKGRARAQSGGMRWGIF